VAVVGSGHRIVIEGVAAVVRLGYQPAATLGAWKVDGDRFIAAVQSVDGFRITQGPLTLEIANADGIPTRRPLGDVTVYQGQLSARLLPKRQDC
jgi:hypothetical protein